MELVKLMVIFMIILLLLNARVPLYLAMICGTLLSAVLFRISPGSVIQSAAGTLTGWGMWSVIISMFVISVLIQQLRLRNRFDGAQKAMNGLLKDSRINTSLACIFVGLMPGPATVTICGDMIDKLAGDRMTNAEKAAVAGCMRHIPENIFPTFPGVMIACSITRIPMSSFVLGSLPLLVLSIFCQYVFYLRRVPKTVGGTEGNVRDSIRLLLRSLWTLLLAIAVITIFNLETWQVIVVVSLINILVDHLSLQEAKTALIRGLELPSLIGIAMTYVFKDVLVSIGLIDKLPDYFVGLPIHPFLIAALLMSIGTVVGGTFTSVVTFMPLAMKMIPNGGTLLVILLMGLSYASSQISPTHICTPIISEYFHVTFLQTVIRMIPPMLLYGFVICVSYFLLSGILM